MKRLLTLGLTLFALVLGCAASARASGLEALEHFLQTARGARAEFTQVVTAPGRDGGAPRSKASSGVLEFQRPRHFRFVYRKPFEQTIVADGKTLWLYDLDLNQVTARPQARALDATPVALIATASDLRSLQADFLLQNAPDLDGLQWVNGAPRAPDSQVLAIRVGFRGAELAALEILDNFGQRSALRFSGLQLNPVFAPDAFVFKPPAGADLIRP
jgi:outer membrane lipoprotein carrier protein